MPGAPRTPLLWVSSFPSWSDMTPITGWRKVQVLLKSLAPGAPSRTLRKIMWLSTTVPAGMVPLSTASGAVKVTLWRSSNAC